ncbi:MAG TPA: amino acid racemase [Fimbriimonadaceae bacterium]|nr:amino acid racemase [Fimbriimonadaceae bacterium]
MKKLGIVGGLGPESTIDYYRLLVAEYQSRISDGSYPPVFIDCIDLGRMLAWANESDWRSMTNYVVESIETLARAGADFALISANTPHIVFDQVAERSRISLLSIVETACAAAKADGRKRLGLFGTRFTMQARFYPDVFEREGLSLVVPTSGEQDWIQEKYFGELVKGVFLPKTRDGLMEIVGKLVARHRIDGLLLAGTELPLILRDVVQTPVPFYDTAQIHVSRAVDEMLS